MKGLQEFGINDTIKNTFCNMYEMGVYMKKQIIAFVMILIMALFGIYSYMTNPSLQEKLASYTEEDFSEDNIYSDIEGLSKRLSEEIMKGSQSFTVYLKDMDVDAIDDINQLLDGVFGSGATYKQMGVIGNTYKKVVITIKRTTNYYALKAYIENEPIPDTEHKAKQLYERIEFIMSECVKDDMTDFEKEVALHDYLVKNCRYSEDVEQPAGSDIYRAYGALVNQDAVCNGYAEALQLLFACAGIESQFVIGTADGIEHAWNLVKLDNEWYHLDATWDDPVPDRGDVAIHAYFNVPDTMLDDTHTWKKEMYPQAKSMNHNYYTYNNLYYSDFDEYKTNAYEKMVNEGESYYEAAMQFYTEDEDEMQFFFEGNNAFQSISWQTFHAGDFFVLILQAE